MKDSKYCLIDWLGALHDSHKGSIVWLGGEAKGISEILDTTVDELNTMAEQLIRNPVQHGRWIEDIVNGQKCMWCSNCRNIVYPCSNCGYGRNVLTYCHVCGSKNA